MPVFLEDNFLIPEPKISFGLVRYPSRILIYKNCPLGWSDLVYGLSCQWIEAQQSAQATDVLVMQGARDISSHNIDLIFPDIQASAPAELIPVPGACHKLCSASP